MWYLVGDKNVHIPAKCGSTSFERAVGPSNRIVAPIKGKENIFVVRDPVERFISWWRFCQVEHWKYHRIGDIFKFGLYGCTPDHLMYIIEKHPDLNRHWLKQSCCYTEGSVVVHHSEVLNFLGYKARHDNKASTPRPMAIPLKRILTHYREDVALFKKAI